MRIHVYGDTVNWKSIPNAILHPVDFAELMTTQPYQLNTNRVEPNDIVCICFNETIPRIGQTTITNTQIDEFIQSIQVPNTVAIQSFLPTTRDKELTQANLPFTTNEHERKRRILELNEHLKSICDKKGYVYLDLCRPYADSEGFLNQFLAKDTIRIGFDYKLKNVLSQTLLFSPQAPLFKTNTRIVIPQFDPYNKPAGAASLHHWMKHFLEEIKYFIAEITVANNIPYWNKPKPSQVTNEVILFWGNANVLNSRTLQSFQDFCSRRNLPHTRVFWGILEGTKMFPSVHANEVNDAFDRIWAGSDHVRDVMKRHGISKAVTVPNGIQHRIFNHVPKTNTNLEQQLPSKCKFLCVATDVPRKNLDALVQAFKLEFATETVQEVCLVMRTNNNRFRGIDPKIFTITNELSNDILGEITKSCHYFVLPSHSEGFCLPACEALACGKRIIVPYHQGVKTFAHPEDVYAIPFTMEPISNSIHDMLGEWAVMKIEDIRKAMRAAYTDINKQAMPAKLDPRFSWFQIALTQVFLDSTMPFLGMYAQTYMPLLHWFSDWYYVRGGTFFMIFEYLESRVLERKKAGKPTWTHILETGCTRTKGSYSDGNSTIMFDHFVNTYDGLVTSIDIDPQNCELCDSITTDKVHMVCQDSVNAIYQMPPETPDRPIDVVYLDSYDLDIAKPHDSAMHHLKELTALLPKLRTETLIVVDDCLSKDVGKGMYVRQYFEQIGIKPYFEAYQIGYLWNQGIKE